MGEGEKLYVGQTANTFKTRLNGHNSDVRTEKRRTALCTYMIDQTKKGNEVKEIKWSKIKAIQPKKKGEKLCRLCNLEKTLIAIGPNNLLNHRSEILQRCRHKDALVLTNNYRGPTRRRQEIHHVSTDSSAQRFDLSVPGRPPDEPSDNSGSVEEDEIGDQGRPIRTGSQVDYSRFF